ncbi:MAG: hypothetical protein QW356_04445 [Candidatus Hadarchaeales archaeon]
MRRSVLAAVLNALLWGTGYLYLKRRVPLGLSLVLFVFCAVNMYQFYMRSPALALALGISAYLLLSLALAWDAYQEAGSCQ